ncbi:MAG: site-specific DNA-methyltransferase [Clostridia bacterium]|jgi:adenine specific DNA methylase Mod|nr:site-specific DNA-methyltransferase [Clostridia bacterium]
MAKNTKLELTWIGKDTEVVIEPRILLEVPEKGHSFKVNKKGQTTFLNDNNATFENMLIHGDNLLALKALEQDYAGKVKCIYIDPPYNTGSAFEHYDDNLEHSTWLNLMKPRLELLKNLLRDDGVIFASIDDAEVAYLKVLMDEIFGRYNFIANLPTIMNLKGNQDQSCFAGTHEYTLVFAKDKLQIRLYNYLIDEDEVLRDWEEDEIGLYKKGATLKSTGEESARIDRPKMFYPILCKNNQAFSITEEEYNKLYNSVNNKFNDEFLKNICDKYVKEGYEIILPYKNENEYGRWRWGFDNFFSQFNTEIIVLKSVHGLSLYKKQRPTIGDIPTTKPKTLFYKPEYSSGNGTAQIKKLFGYNAFLYPKPEDLIKDFITIGSSPNDIVLDSFLGSGTTSAVAHKMGRRWIGIEMGEHAYTHCKPRLDMVVDGTDQGGISKSVNWKGGGGYKFYELAPTLIIKDKFDKEIINPEYNASMLAAAMAKQEGFVYYPNSTNCFKQGYANEKSFIFTTTNHLTHEYLNEIANSIAGDEYLVVACKSFASGIEKLYRNITIKKIPQTLLGKCEFGKDNYNLNIISLPTTDEVEE